MPLSFNTTIVSIQYKQHLDIQIWEMNVHIYSFSIFFRHNHFKSHSMAYYCVNNLYSYWVCIFIPYVNISDNTLSQQQRREHIKSYR